MADKRQWSRLEQLSDKDLGRCAREVIGHVLVPGLASDDPVAAVACRDILNAFLLASLSEKPHQSLKWTGLRAVRIVAMVLRRNLAGMTDQKAFEDIANNHALPVDATQSKERTQANDPVSWETVKKLHARASHNLDELGILPVVKRLAVIECARICQYLGRSVPETALAPLAPFERELPDPLLPPDFRKRVYLPNGSYRLDPEPPEWKNWPVQRYLMASHDLHLLAARRDTKPKKPRKRAP